MKDQYLHYAGLVKSTSEIKTRFLTSRFKDPVLEENYVSHLLKNMKSLIVTYLIMLILVYIALIYYGTLITKLEIYFIVNSICLLITFTLTIIYLSIKDHPYIKSYIELTCYFLFSFNLMITSYTYMELDFENFRVLRIIYCLILIKNLSLLIWSQSIFLFWLLFSVFHIIFFTLCVFIFKKFNASIIDEIVIEIITSIISFAIKKFFDSVLRITYLQTIKLQNYFDYNKKLINCMSGFHITFAENRLIYMNDNTKSSLNSLMKNTDKYKGNLLNLILFIFLILILNNKFNFNFRGKVE